MAQNKRVDTSDAKAQLDDVARYGNPDELGTLLIGLRKVERQDSTGLLASIANTISGALRVRAGI